MAINYCYYRRILISENVGYNLLKETNTKNMKNLILTICFILLSVFGFAQEESTKKTYRDYSWINIENRINEDKIKFYYAPKNSNTEVKKKYNEIYDEKGNLISYQIKTVKVKADSKEIKTNDAALKKLELNKAFKANFNVKGDSIYINPWLFSGENEDEKNKFFDENDVFIKMDDRTNYSFRHRSWSLRVVTLPIKWYMSSELGNVETDLNALINIGWNFGKERFVKFPHEKKTRHYKTLQSLNFLAGLSKLEINESNRINNSTIEGNVAAFSMAGAYGIHFGKFSALLAIGFDVPLSNRKDWKFTDTPFLGIGFGYDFLSF